MRFLMDFIMPPLKNCKLITDVSPTQNNNYMPAPGTSENYGRCDYIPKLLNNLKMLRTNSTLCDVEIIAGNKIIKAHRVVLAASSPYFTAMFTRDLCERDKQSIELHAIPPHLLDTIIDFIYSGEILINQNNVQDLMTVADMLELDDLKVNCSEYLIKELHPVNAIGIYRFADIHNCENLKQAAIQYVNNHFPKVCEEDEIYDLSKEQIIKFLSSEYLLVDSECQVFQMAVRWIMHDVVQRKQFVFEILKYVRLPLIPLVLLERTLNECNDGSLRVALKSVQSDLISKKGCLVPLNVHPRLCAKKNIFIIGGSKRELQSVINRPFESNYVSIERYDTFKGEWCKASSMNLSRIVPGVATLNRRIFVVGGEHGSNILACGQCYDPQEDSWTGIASMIIPRCEFGMCALNGYLYALGGWLGGDIGGNIERYDCKLNSWAIVDNLPQPRFSMGVVSYEGLIYMVGGCTQFQRHLDDLLSYNPKTKEWTTLPSMSVARSQMGVAVLDDHLYVVGGNNRDQMLNSVERYSFKKRKWSKVPTMKEERSGPAVAAVDGLLYVIGGYHNHERQFYRAQVTLSSVECYNPLTNSWSDCPPLPESRAEAGAVVL